MSQEAQARQPEDIEARIVETRASLERRLEELERRLSPREHLKRVATRVHAQQYVPWAAAAAILAGLYLAVRGLRRYHHVRPLDEDDLLSTTFVICEEDELLGEI